MKRRDFAAHRTPAQMALRLPPMPKESPLREAFRRAELARLGMDFRSVHGHPRGAQLLRGLAAAYERADHGAARLYAGHLIRMRSAFR